MGTPFDDEDVLLLLFVAVEEDASQRRSMAREQRRRFTTFLTIADSSCWRSLFRFSEDEIDLVGRLLQIPAELPTRNGYDISGKDAFCMFLRLLAYPNRLADLERLFGRSQAALSVITNAVLTHI
ncbi:TPA: hypothetical protein N0F65_006561 [Lagenidium giganteum]|uniref:Transposase Helix-turn-helix domain-containing protein n=1 Tax=Lagenidium giganteum TaxID=4803 RepID=A0AAV2YPQ0_9STRA|nr:TPA: hypothetical protein N0F65_006561 [Lagenidium giganteum]